jgi:threonine synthase
MRMVEQASEKWGLYLLNSVNPWRIEGQKTIIFELLQQRGWNPPDWIVFPAGNLGNTSAFGKALREIREMGFIEETPRLAAVQAEGASPFYNLWLEGGESLKPVLEPKTVASAIRIGAPVSWRKATRAIRRTEGVVLRVSDQEIMDAKAVVDSSGIGCEPASAASVAGAKELVNTGTIDRGEEVVCVLTGALLKDPDATVQYHMGEMENIQPRFANRPTTAKPELESIAEVVTSFLD